MPQNLSPYFTAAVMNHEYTKQALCEFNKKNVDLQRIGFLMNGHHKVLKDLLSITVPKIDVMIDAALNAGALGAKINGSGGGGSIVVLAPGKEDEVCFALEKVDAEAFPVQVDSGARMI